MVKVYNVFISHSWDHVNDLIRLRNLLNAKGYFNVKFTEGAPMNPIHFDWALFHGAMNVYLQSFVTKQIKLFVGILTALLML